MFELIKKIPSPEQLKQEIQLPMHLKKIKDERDLELRKIIMGESDKFLLIIGPCSADDSDALCDYVSRLARVQEKVKDKLFLVPRVYTNKPRTNGKGYKGMLHQPDPTGESNILEGIRSIRKMHIKAINESHLTAADEMLYPENFSFMEDLLSYHAVGARSVENQSHRLVSSGVEAPVGMKNPTSGDLSVMFNSIIAAQSSHTFLYRDSEVKTSGNPLAHGILRGSVNKHGENIQNYHYEDLMKTFEIYSNSGLLNPAIIVDLNHSNSGKKHNEQIRIAKEIMASRRYNNNLKTLIKGLMIESYIEEGRQEVSDGVYGKSITDPCISFASTESLLLDLAEKI